MDSKKNIPVQVMNRVAWTGWNGYIICGNTDYTITFTFDEEWGEATAKTARFKFRTDEGMMYTDQPFTGDTVAVPMLSNIREVEVGVYVGDLNTTTGATIRCVPSILCGSGKQSEYEERRFDELMQMFNDLLHKHNNKKTLDLFYCESLETGFATDASSTELKWRGMPVAFDFAGSKVSMVQEVEKNGKLYYRLWFTHNTLSVTNVPDYIDIPISGVTNVEEEQGPDITLNGSELEFEKPDNSTIENRIELLENDMAQVGLDLRDLSSTIGEIQNGIDKVETSETVAMLQPNTDYSFGKIAELSITFAEGEANKRNEYMFSFISGETATVLTLPSSVKWVNELTVESNKRYEISVVDNVALWCAVDYEVTE